jgi:ubiquinone/menaquinone biosynthesis C-methylase UbiE
MPIGTSSVLLDPEAVLARAGVRAGFTVADLGCGTTGYFILPAARMVGPAGRAIAVDIIKSILTSVASRARFEGLTSLETLWADCESPGGVKLVDNTCDITLVVNNMYQAKKRGVFLAEAARITKPGGKVVVIDWKTAASPLGPLPAQRVAPEIIKPEAEKVGLTLIESYEPGPYHWGMNFTK